MKIQNVTLGSDAEFFVRLRSADIFVPAIGMVGGTKEAPRPMGKGGYFIQEDNVSVEFNIPVAKTTKDFVNYIAEGLDRCANQLPEAVIPATVASAVFDSCYIDFSAKAQEFGCEPDINAWTRKVNPRPKAVDKYLRSAGGHVHIGWKDPDMETRFELIKACDVFVSLPALSEDGDMRRRELYGKAGAMRIKQYGVEHRVLSNYWIFDPTITALVAGRYMKAISFVNNGHQVAEEDSEAIVSAINKGSWKEGRLLMQKYNAMVK